MTKNVFKYMRRLFFEKISGINMGMTTVVTSNKFDRKTWIEKALSKIPAVSRILDAGAGEQQYKRFCFHLDYVAQDFAQYNGKGNSAGLQVGNWD